MSVSCFAKWLVRVGLFHELDVGLLWEYFGIIVRILWEYFVIIVGLSWVYCGKTLKFSFVLHIMVTHNSSIKKNKHWKSSQTGCDIMSVCCFAKVTGDRTGLFD